MADPAEIGQYGTIKLLKRREPTTVVASYPVDDDEVTFGRDATCSVRLYYQWVSSTHCKLVFEERKAFLQILGANGVIVDGCPVYPAKNSIPGSSPTTVPLPNGSTFEIHKKLFMFNYPPKELRPQLFTPVAESKQRKNIRMSMVQSARVFSPAPSPNPSDNLRILQSPLKLSSLAEEEPVILVDGNNPLVFQEEQDLVILENVDPSSKAGSPPPALPMLPLRPPQTPRRKSIPSLHRAVLIRSAQRVQQMHEYQTQRQRIAAMHPEPIQIEDDAAEEDEVEEAVSEDLITLDESDEEVVDEDTEGEEDAENIVKWEAQVGNEEMSDEQDITEARTEYDEEIEEPIHSLESTPKHANAVPALGKFMTPQPHHFSHGLVKEEEEDVKPRTGPQRPPPGYRFSLGPGIGIGALDLRASEEHFKNVNSEAAPSRSTSPTKSRPEVTEEERKAIIERRKSALKAPDAEFADHVPGLGARRTSIAPPTSATPLSPFKSIRNTIDEGEDTRNVLHRLEESLENMRGKSLSRQSIGPGRGSGLPVSPEKSGFSLLARGAALPSSFDKSKIVKRDLRMPSYGRDMSALAKGTANQLMKDEMEEREDDMELDVVEDDKADEPLEEVGNSTDKSGSPGKETKAARRLRRSEIVPLTPRLDGVKDLFREPKMTAGLATPAIRGMRELFRDRSTIDAPATPRLDGVRSLFAERRVPETPAYDGIDGVLHETIMEEVEEPAEGKEGDDGEIELETTDCAQKEDHEVHDEPEPEATTVPRTAARPRGRLIRGTPTDLSTMADDEMTPDLAVALSPKKRAGAADANEGAVVHKTSRVRKTTGKRSAETAGGKSAESKSKKPSSRQTRRAEDAADEEAVAAPKPAKAKGRAPKTVSSVTSTEAESNAASKPTRRARTETATANSEDEQPAVRSTRARSRSIEPEGEGGAPEDALAATTTRYRRGTRPKAQVGTSSAVETIPEEEEAAPAPTQNGTSGKGSTSRSRKAQVATSTDAEGTGHSDSSAPALAKKKPSSRSRALKELAPVEAEAARADKENTPERSPASSSESNNEEQAPAKTGARARAAPKTAAGKLTGSKIARPGKSAKASTEEASVAAAPRTTRARARK